MYPAFLFPGSGPRVDRREPAAQSLRWWNPISWYRAGSRSRSADLLVVPYVHPFLALAIGTIIRSASPTPAVVVVHNATPHERFPLQRALMAWCLKRAARGIVHSQHVADLVAASLPELPLTIAAHPPNLEVGQEPPPAQPPLRLLFLGYVRPYKGLAMCIEAVGEAIRSGLDVHLTVAGEFWEDQATYVELTRSIDAERFVSLEPGYVPDSEVSNRLATHHAVVAPYLKATQSGIIPLAFAAGRPVIVTDVGGLSEQVVDGSNGVVDATVTAKGFAESIIELARNYGRLQAGAASSTPHWEDLAAVVARRPQKGSGSER